AYRTVEVRLFCQAAIPLDIAEGHLVVGLEARECFRIHKIGSFTVGNGQRQDVARFQTAEPERVRSLDADVRVVAVESEGPVPEKRAWQQVGLREHLEAIAYPEHGPACLRERHDRRHHGSKAGDRPCPQRVTVRETAGQHHRVDTRERAFTVVNHDRIDAVVRGERVKCDVVTVAAWDPYHRNSWLAGHHVAAPVVPIWAGSADTV